MTIEISKVIDTIKAQSLQMAKEKELIPILFVVTEYKVGVLPMDFSDTDSKSFYANAIPNILQETNAIGYAMISESWQAKLDKNDSRVQFLLSGEIRVSDLPMDDREELISLVVVENHKKMYYYTAMIKSFNYPRVIDDFVEQNSTDMVGKFLVKDW